jgi:hypothetical protein
MLYFKKTILTLIVCLPLLMAAQTRKSNPISLSVFNNATLLPPASFTAVFNQPIHAGIAAGYEFGWKEKKKGKWFQDAEIGFYNHRYVYRALLLYSKAGYRWYFGHFSVEGSLHAGYMHAFLITDRLVPRDDGSYKAKKGFGKPQFITGAGAGIGYDFAAQHLARRVFLNYDVRLQMPFVKSYVTLLPNGVVSLGMQFCLK